MSQPLRAAVDSEATGRSSRTCPRQRRLGWDCGFVLAVHHGHERHVSQGAQSERAAAPVRPLRATATPPLHTPAQAHTGRTNTRTIATVGAASDFSLPSSAVLTDRPTGGGAPFCSPHSRRRASSSSATETACRTRFTRTSSSQAVAQWRTPEPARACTRGRLPSGLPRQWPQLSSALFVRARWAVHSCCSMAPRQASSGRDAAGYRAVRVIMPCGIRPFASVPRRAGTLRTVLWGIPCCGGTMPWGTRPFASVLVRFTQIRRK